MGRTFLIAALAASLAACEDPLVIVGDLPGFMRITAGVGDSSGIRVDSLALRTRLTRPTGSTVSKTGVLYFADQSSRIFSVTSAGRLRVLHTAIGCFVKTCLGRPQGVALTADETALLIADDMSDKIWRLHLTSLEFSAIAGTGTHGVATDGTVATAATLASPNGIAVLPDGRIIFAERNSNSIRSIGTDGMLRTFASGLNVPNGLTVTGNTVYVTEAGTHTVRAIDISTGASTVIAGRGGSGGFSGDGGPAVNADLNLPTSVTATEDNVYIADQLNNRVRVVNLSSGIINTFAGTGAQQFTGNGKPAGQTALSSPTSVSISPFGYLYISDWGHHVIWRTPVRVLTN